MTLCISGSSSSATDAVEERSRETLYDMRLEYGLEFRSLAVVDEVVHLSFEEDLLSK